MITVNQEQIDQAKIWEKKLAEGGCNLNDALYMCMDSGAPISANMLQRYDAAINSYNRGECKDLAEPFGIAQSTTQKNVMLKYLKRLHIRDLVDYHVDLGYSKSRPIKGSEKKTAFDMVADILDKNAEHILKEYYDSKK